MPAHTLIHDLVQRFNRRCDAYHAGHYNEAQARRESVGLFRGAGLERERLSRVCHHVSSHKTILTGSRQTAILHVGKVEGTTWRVLGWEE
jgi:hypothetical protein